MDTTLEYWFSIAGSIASIIGIVLTYRQVKAVKKVADATKESAELTQKSLIRSLSTVRTAKFCESIIIIQDAVKDDEIRLAIHLCHELKTALIELQQSLSTYSENEESGKLSGHIQALGVNITNMHKALPDKKDKLRKSKIIEDLENLHNQMSEMQAKFKLNTV